MSMNKISFDDRIRPKKILALNEKVAAIRRYEIEPVYKKVGRYFNCSPDQIKRIIQQKDSILSEWNNRTKKSIAATPQKVIKTLEMSFLEKAVYEWIRRMMYYSDFNLTDSLIQTMSSEFAKAMGLQNFSTNKEWAINFRNIYDLEEGDTKHLKIGYSESYSVQLRDILIHLQQNRETVQISKEVTSTSMAIKKEASSTDTEAEVEVKMEIETESVQNEQLQKETSSKMSSVVNDQYTDTTLHSMLGDQTIKTEPVTLQEELKKPPNESVITYEEAMKCVKLLEEFALLKENFRMIGLIERIEESLKQESS